MSLQVWLPFNGTLENKGLYDDKNLTISGTPNWDDDGKIGKCLKGGITISAINNPMQYEGTLAFWIYVDSESVGGQVFGNAPTTAGADNRKWSLFLFPNAFTLHSWGCQKDDSTSANNSFVINNALPSGKWSHVVYAHNRKEQYVYVNGELINTTSWNSNADFTFDIKTQILYNNAKIKLNDYRIYDECLSKRQIKELAKGLIAHYRLSRPTDNIFINSTFENGTSNWGRSKWFKY